MGRDSHTSLRPLRGLCGRGQVALDDLRVALASFLCRAERAHVVAQQAFLVKHTRTAFSEKQHSFALAIHQSYFKS